MLVECPGTDGGVPLRITWELTWVGQIICHLRVDRRSFHMSEWDLKMAIVHPKPFDRHNLHDEFLLLLIYGELLHHHVSFLIRGKFNCMTPIIYITALSLVSSLSDALVRIERT
jgi:hypothetical protein